MDIYKTLKGLQCCQISMSDDNPFEKCNDCPYNDLGVNVEDCRAALSNDSYTIIKCCLKETGLTKKNKLFEFLDNWWAVFWFVAGVVFFVFATIAIYNGENSEAKSCLAICLACHARSEVKILQKKIDNK